MDEDDRLIEIWRKTKDKFGHKFDLQDFMIFCHEWDAICEKLRKAAGRE